MVGGFEKDYANAEEVLSCISHKHKLVGTIGHDQYLKKINQAVLANTLAVNAEAVELTKRCGMDPKLLREYLEFDIPETLNTENYSGGGHLALHYKDLSYLNVIAHDVCAGIASARVLSPILACQPAGANWNRKSVESFWCRSSMISSRSRASGSFSL